jgi:hypothetical protein
MTKDQRSAVVSSLITEVAVPEILSFVRRRHEETGALPSEEDVRAHLEADANAVIARGEVFLREHALKAGVVTDVAGNVVGGE